MRVDYVSSIVSTGIKVGDDGTENRRILHNNHRRPFTNQNPPSLQALDKVSPWCLKNLSLPSKVDEMDISIQVLGEELAATIVASPGDE